MRRISYLGILACLVGGLAWHRGAAMVPMPHPDDGVVKNKIFTSTYFNLSYPLPSGWTEGTAGPGPSVSGYYVLTTLIPKGQFTATILIAAQDAFFPIEPFADAAAMTQEFSRAMSAIDGMTIDRPPSEVQIAGRRFSRIDFSGVGLFRSTLTTEIRCHFVSFNLTAKTPELLADLVLGLNRLGYARDSDIGRVDPITSAGQSRSAGDHPRLNPYPSTDCHQHQRYRRKCARHSRHQRAARCYRKRARSLEIQAARDGGQRH
jgi:hypothetical protein